MNEKYRIVVDAGHGGSDPGAVNGNIKEKDFNLKAANYIYNRLKELGVPVAITRNNDEDIGRVERLNRMLNSFGNDSDVIILSNHINAGGGEGAEVVYSLRNDDTLSKMILNEIGNAGQVQRKVYQRRLPEDPSKDYYYIMRETPNTEAVLIEYGFIDNPRDLVKLQNNILDYAEGVVKAVAGYIGIPYIPPVLEESNIYTVKKGDTLWSIANKNGVTVDELKRVNNLDSNLLNIGQKLLIPTREDILQEDYTIYVVKNGDTLYSIAKSFDVSVEELLTLNRLNSPELYIGEQLLIPTNGIQIVGVVDYIIKPGDTLWRIANNCNVTVDDIVKLNNLESTIIYPGQTIKLSESCAAKQDNNENNYVESEDIYTVRRGDTLYSIARLFGTNVQELINNNNLTSDLLYIGQQLKVPKDNYIEYTVQKNDTLYGISRRYNIPINIIRELNNLNSDLLQINQILLLPKKNV